MIVLPMMIVYLYFVNKVMGLLDYGFFHEYFTYRSHCTAGAKKLVLGYLLEVFKNLYKYYTLFVLK